MPQLEQNRAGDDIGAPQAGQPVPSRGAPQVEQNLPDPELPQAGHVVGESLIDADRVRT